MNKLNQCVEPQTAKQASCVFHQDSLLHPSELKDLVNSIPFDPISQATTVPVSIIVEHLQVSIYCDIYLPPSQYYKNQITDTVTELPLNTHSNVNTTYSVYKIQ